MGRVQILVQLSEHLLSALDERAARQGRSRSELIRDAVERYVSTDAEAEIDRQIVEGYRRIPPEDMWGDEPAIGAIREEPW